MRIPPARPRSTSLLLRRVQIRLASSSSSSSSCVLPISTPPSSTHSRRRSYSHLDASSIGSPSSDQRWMTFESFEPSLSSSTHLPSPRPSLLNYPISPLASPPAAPRYLPRIRTTSAQPSPSSTLQEETESEMNVDLDQKPKISLLPRLFPSGVPDPSPSLPHPPTSPLDSVSLFPSRSPTIPHSPRFILSSNAYSQQKPQSSLLAASKASSYLLPVPPPIPILSLAAANFPSSLLQPPPPLRALPPPKFLSSTSLELLPPSDQQQRSPPSFATTTATRGAIGHLSSTEQASSPPPPVLAPFQTIPLPEKEPVRLAVKKEKASKKKKKAARAVVQAKIFEKTRRYDLPPSFLLSAIKPVKTPKPKLQKEKERRKKKMPDPIPPPTFLLLASDVDVQPSVVSNPAVAKEEVAVDLKAGMEEEILVEKLEVEEVEVLAGPEVEVKVVATEREGTEIKEEVVSLESKLEKLTEESKSMMSGGDIASTSPLLAEALRLVAPLFDRHLAVLNEIKLELQAQRRAEPSSANGTKSEPSTPTAETPVVVRASGPVGGKKGLGGMRKEGSVVRIQTRKYSSHTSASLESAVERGTSDPFPAALHLRDLFKSASSPHEFENAVKFLGSNHASLGRNELCFNAFLDASIRLSLIPRAMEVLADPSSGADVWIRIHPDSLKYRLRGLIAALVPAPSALKSNDEDASTTPTPLPFTSSQLNTFNRHAAILLPSPDLFILALSLRAYYLLGASGNEGVRAVSALILASPNPARAGRSKARLDEGERLIQDLDAIRPFVAPEIISPYETFPNPYSSLNFHRTRLLSLVNSIAGDDPLATSIRYLSVPPTPQGIPATLPPLPKLLEAYLRPSLLVHPNDWFILLLSIYLRRHVGRVSSSSEFFKKAVEELGLKGEADGWTRKAPRSVYDGVGRLVLREIEKDLVDGLGIQKGNLWDEVLGEGEVTKEVEERREVERIQRLQQEFDRNRSRRKKGRMETENRERVVAFFDR